MKNENSAIDYDDIAQESIAQRKSYSKFERCQTKFIQLRYLYVIATTAKNAKNGHLRQTSSCRALVMLLAWGTCGGFPIFAIRMAEVNMEIFNLNCMKPKVSSSKTHLFTGFLLNLEL